MPFMLQDMPSKPLWRGTLGSAWRRALPFLREPDCMMLMILEEPEWWESLSTPWYSQLLLGKKGLSLPRDFSALPMSMAPFKSFS